MLKTAVRMSVAATMLVVGLAIGTVAPAAAAPPPSTSVTVGPVDATTNSASNFDSDGKWIGDGAASVPITFTGFDSVTNLFVTISAPDGGSISIDTTGKGSSITRANGYPSWTSLPSISFFGLRTEIATLLASKVSYVPPSNGGTYNVQVSIIESASGVYYNPANEHYYKPVTSGSNVSWTSAKSAAAASTFNGLNGYLVTVTSREENDFIKNYVGTTNIWIGATDSATEGTWKWDTGPEAGTSFWTGQGSSGSQVSDRFSYWNKNEPNDSSGEDYAVTNFSQADGRWNDLSNTASVKNYLIEYGGLGTFTGLRAVGSTSLTGSVPFTIGTMSGATFTAGDIVWASSTTKPFAIALSRFGSATSTNFTATLTLNGASMGTLTMLTTTGLSLGTGFSSFSAQTSIGFTGTRANVIAALKNLQWNTPTSRKDLEVQVTLGEIDTDYYLNPSNGHYYKMVSNGGNITWGAARTAAANATYKGMSGYLATITSSGENDFIKSKVPGTGVWIGASDNEDFVNEASIIQRDNTEGRWTWVAGPEAGTQFWQGNYTGSAVSGRYTSWRSGEPNNASDGCGLFQSCNYRDEDYGYTNASGNLGMWNDVYGGSSITRYLIEFGGMPNQASTAKSAVDVVGLGKVPDAPTAVSGVSNSVHAATVSWTAPAYDGNRAIASYKVTAYDGVTNAELTGKTCTSTAPTTSCTVSGISRPTAKFKVAAINSVGTGTLSAASSAASIIDNGEPAAPTGVTASVSGNDVTVAWTAPTDIGTSALLGYTATASPGGDTCTSTPPTTTCTFSSLAAGTYTFTVVATNSGGNSPDSDPSVSVSPGTNTSAPGVPTNLIVTVTDSGSATISFTPPSDAGSSDITSYTITASPGGLSCTAYPPETSCTITGLDPNVTYTFSATASNGNGSSGSSTPSVSVDAGTPTSPPGAPTDVRASVASDGTVTVSFKAPLDDGTSDITYYIVTAYDADGNVAGTCTAIAPATTCDITGLASGVTYKFDVVAYNSNGASSSSVKSVGVDPGTQTTAPDAPTDLVVAVTTIGQATISFTPPSNAGSSDIVSYTITSSPGGLSCTAYPPETSCTIKGLDPTKTYTFTGTAANGNGASIASATSVSVDAGTLTSVPTAPTGVQASVAANGTVTVAFKTPSDEGSSDITSYVVTAYNSSGVAVSSCTATAPATTCDITGLTSGQDYTFDVVAKNGNGTSSASAESVAVDPGTVTSAPGAPTNLIAAVTTIGQATVSFTPPTDAGSSAITEYTITASPGGLSCTATAPATSCTITGLDTTKSYTFSATASNGNATSSSSANSVSVDAGSLTSAPATPTNIIVAVTSIGEATVSFTASASAGTSDITGYTVTASPGGLSCTVTPPATSCTITGLDPTKTYTFDVTASNGNGTSSSATSVSVNAGALTSAPAAPTNVMVSIATSGSATVSFTPPSSAGTSAISGYVVTASPGGATCTVTPPATSCTITGLDPSVTYTFAVTASNGNGTSVSSDDSVSVNAGTITSPPTAPRSIVVTVPSAGTVRVSFSAPLIAGTSDITRYVVTAYNSNGTVAGTCEVVAPATSCTISGLSTTKSYTFGVMAANGNGLSQSSARTKAIRPQPGATDPGSTTPAPAVVTLKMDVNIGDSTRLNIVPLLVQATGLLPGSEVVLLVYSRVRIIGRATVVGDGTVSTMFSLPTNLEPGNHHLILQGIEADGTPFQREILFTLDDNGVLTSKSAVRASLPETGSSSSNSMEIALTSIAIGMMALVCTRRLKLVRRID